MKKILNISFIGLFITVLFCACTKISTTTHCVPDVEVRLLKSNNKTNAVLEFKFINNCTDTSFYLLKQNECYFKVAEEGFQITYPEVVASNSWGNYISDFKIVIPEQVELRCNTMQIVTIEMGLSEYAIMTRDKPDFLDVGVVVLRSRIRVGDKADESLERFDNIIKSKGVSIYRKIDIRDYWNSLK